MRESSSLTRFGVSMEHQLLKSFDELIIEKGYNNRSEAVRDLVREALVKESRHNKDQFIAGCIQIFYDHHQRGLMENLTTIQHEYHDMILATTHIHLDQHNCLEMIVVKGKAKDLQQLSNQLLSIKGVKYGDFSVTPVSIE
ncbi:nickel-responsive transcriptional regulator NikR [Aquibacillus koreensis]|uniref:Putative nickel-responsive regulator n=1 Tax=Aquibacillus koreensis TaxID=279446 RepID=A0A9X3WSP5_9BACI|nr:nickel-responsive transcriptional regulator NikR [Aquibacillus koreensis]MCT2537876.1 nickel-responsive transcriptional regulator NikR [Aquibacillus koreensis]MDC3422644.1 nickel-responsive transcriptional regulator NikR [Aquibacillus koreensis]